MHTATFRFYGDLNFFLPRNRKGKMFEHSLDSIGNNRMAGIRRNVPILRRGTQTASG